MRYSLALLSPHDNKMANKVDKEGDDIFNAIDELEDSDNSEVSLQSIL